MDENYFDMLGWEDNGSFAEMLSMEFGNEQEAMATAGIAENETIELAENNPGEALEMAESNLTETLEMAENSGDEIFQMITTPASALSDTTFETDGGAGASTVVEEAESSHGGVVEKKKKKRKKKDVSTTPRRKRAEKGSKNWGGSEDVSFLDLDFDEYFVEELLDRKEDEQTGTLLYHVKWMGFPPEQNTWEPLKNLEKCLGLVDELDAKMDGRLEPVDDVGTPSREDRSASEEFVDSGIASSTASVASVKKRGRGRPKKVKASDTPEVAESSNARARTRPRKLKPQLEKEAKEKEKDEQADADSDPISDLKKFIEEETFGPRFRHELLDNEIPLCIVGSSVLNNNLLHMVRLAPPAGTDSTFFEAIKENPFHGLEDENQVVLVLSEEFRYQHPKILLEYYDRCVELTDYFKTDDELAEAAARAAFYWQVLQNKGKVDAKPIFNDMMGSSDGHKEGSYVLNANSKPMWYETTTGGPKTDCFGLPNSYDGGVSEDDTSNDESSISDDEELGRNSKKRARKWGMGRNKKIVPDKKKEEAAVREDPVHEDPAREPNLSDSD